MMRTSFSFLAMILLLAAAAPLAAQVSDTTRPAMEDTLAAPAPMPPDTAAVEAPPPAVTDTMPPAADATPPAGDPAADAAPAADAPPEAAAPAHDWEFALSAGQAAPGAAGNVLVTEGEADNGYAVVVSGLPAVDSLDQEGRDVAAYTVWVVPSKDRVREATLAGPVTVGADGTGRFEGRTALDTFGILVMATPEGTTSLSGVAVLTGIPVTQAEPAEETPDPVADETPDDVAPETPDEAAPETPDQETPDEAADETPDEVAPETPDEAAPETPDEEPVPPPPGSLR